MSDLHICWRQNYLMVCSIMSKIPKISASQSSHPDAALHFHALECCGWVVSYRLGTLDSPTLEERMYLRACPLFAQGWKNYISACPKLAQPLNFPTFVAVWCSLRQILGCTARSELFLDLAQNSAYPSKIRCKNLAHPSGSGCGRT